ncbi:hypothetical protein [Cellulosimicrobium funkei]|uniref:hypothetical protein n=1 Tax=Cellulosimicrobium funkei TaxID=264251 RepID=UPI0030F88830
MLAESLDLGPDSASTGPHQRHGHPARLPPNRGDAVADSTTIGDATALLGHVDEGATVRHDVKRTHIAPDLRVVIDQLVQQAAADDPQGCRPE